ncbi:MAG: ROK family protein [Cyclobacteriaceae bacterium]
MDIYNDERIVMTLDAGGTNFVFSALQRGSEIVEPLVLPSNSHDLQQCLNTVVEGFKSVKARLTVPPVAISFAFPGPGDYKKGIIGDLPNFPSFRGGVALGPMLENVFDLPTFINNDGDLFTYGEAMAGMLPEINQKLAECGIKREYKNLFGITLGTGFGGGMVINNNLCEGDNSAAGEIWLTRNFLQPQLIAEEGVSIRAIKRVYKEETGMSGDLSPKDIYEIAMGQKEGNKQAALKAYSDMAVVIAESLAHAMTLVDGLIVIGGGIAGAAGLIVPKVIAHLNGSIQIGEADKVPRLVSRVFNVDDPSSWEAFIDDNEIEITVPFTDKKVNYRQEKRIALGLSRLGTNKAVAMGAYAFALNQLEKNKETHFEATK